MEQGGRRERRTVKEGGGRRGRSREGGGKRRREQEGKRRGTEREVRRKHRGRRGAGSEVILEGVLELPVLQFLGTPAAPEPT